MFRKRKFSAVILAGGTSSRMNGVSKQQLSVCGIPVAVRSMLAFENCVECEEIVVVSRADECPVYEQWAKDYGIGKFKKAVPGGATRQESAFIGSKEIDKNADYIAFHDAARCLVGTDDISRVFAEARKNRCAAACAPVSDTIKIAESDKKTSVKNILDRSRLYAMQTPQIFLTDLYLAAAYHAKETGFTGTDDCSLAEHAGFGCKLVECSRTNFKITYPEDIPTAEAIVRFRETK
ncbi:MAG: 2-C-methyl-D-erythritol 4-phosphate cytidylyltransferase [Clostridia bacterium]|nr:2-C-methyl-D-erythritol 4-phosphate cytidylyltransferase [Clostridia bacterium]